MDMSNGAIIFFPRSRRSTGSSVICNIRSEWKRRNGHILREMSCPLMDRWRSIINASVEASAEFESRGTAMVFDVFEFELLIPATASQYGIVSYIEGWL